MSTGDSKTCTKCGEFKPLTEYYKHRDGKDGRHPWCKMCFGAQVKARRDANLEEHRRRDRERYANNPARQEAQKATARAFYLSDVAHAKTTRKAYYEAHWDAWRIYRARRDAKLKNVEREDYTRKEIWERDGGRCRGCEKELPFEPYGFQVDHIVPVDLDGPDIRANVELMCAACNRRKWANLEGQIHLPV